MKRAVLFVSILYLTSLLSLWAITKADQGSLWPVTLFLFSPRWVVATPLIVLIPITLMVRARWMWIHVVSAAVILVPMMGFRFAVSTNNDVDTSGVLRVLTSNLGGGVLHEEQLIDLVVNHQVDVVMLQECPPSVSEPLFAKLGWQHRQQYNLAIGSRLPLGESTVVARHSKEHYHAIAAMSCDLRWFDNGDVRLVSVHLPTFRPALEQIQRFEFDQWPRAVLKMGRRYRSVAGSVREAVQDWDTPVVIAGDFNVPTESIYYCEFWNSYRNSYTEQGSGLGYTKHTRLHGVRIDHVLADQRWTVLKSFVGNSLGGDHRPVIAELAKAKTP
jgi:vancomycin resistance protein VanJ